MRAMDVLVVYKVCSLLLSLCFFACSLCTELMKYGTCFFLEKWIDVIRYTGSHSLCVSVYWNFIEYIQPTECGKPAAKQLVFFSLTFCVSYIRNSFAPYSLCACHFAD